MALSDPDSHHFDAWLCLSSWITRDIFQRQHDIRRNILTGRRKAVSLEAHFAGASTMTRRKRPLFLLLGVCVAMVVAWLSRAGFIRMPGKQTKTESRSKSGEPHYSVTNKNQYDPGVVQFDRSIQFTFPGDSTISPGSLETMTRQMHNNETEIATRLAREIKFPLGH
jgi:hypothetical protein